MDIGIHSHYVTCADRADRQCLALFSSLPDSTVVEFVTDPSAYPQPSVTLGQLRAFVASLRTAAIFRAVESGASSGTRRTLEDL